ncbi:MAG: hypothetical protein VX366_00035 [Candidatus Thermoplasmatota archaeon]|nr:hypothetical protein [Candidatus Thermoplasmatota archaeon]
MDDINWWEERLQAWAHEGFDVEDFRITLSSSEEDASHLILEFEKKVQQNRTLRRRIIDSTLLPDKKGEWLSMLDDVSSTSEVQEKWEKDAEKYRPWEPYIHRSEGKWLERGRRSNLSAIVKRLNSLDPSSYAACQPLLILFDDVSSESLIKSMLDDIEADESRRRSVVNEMIALLNSEGIDASDARGMEISSALDYLSSMQQKAGNLRELRLRIEKEIRPFDEELAARLLSKNDEDGMAEVNAIVENLSSRLNSVKSTIQEWESVGLSLPIDSQIGPAELLDWEAGLPEIEKTVKVHLRALERWKDFQTYWPDRCSDSTLAGKLKHTEEFVTLVDSLDQEWKELELEGMQIVNSWEDKGFVMDSWRSRIAEEPRSAVAWLMQEERKYQSAANIIDSLLTLDASIDGEEEIEKRVAILREFDLENDLLLEMQEYVDSKARRCARHRSMLEMDWLDLVRKGIVEDAPTGALTLLEFEQLISTSALGKTNTSIPIDRLEKRMNEEIDEWEQNGFDVEVLRSQLQEDSMSVALRISSIRDAVSNHERLRRRISGLDWTRSPELSVAINLDLSRPDRLVALSQSIPQLMMDLAQQDVVDENFKFIAWRPQMKMRPILVPAPSNTVEDAMEAILEEMDSEIDDVAHVEDVSSDVSKVEDTKEAMVMIDISSPSEKIEIEEKQVVTSDEPVEDEVEEGKEAMVMIDLATPSEKVENVISENEVVDAHSEKPVAPVVKEPKIEKIDFDSKSLIKLLRSLGLEQDASLLEDNGDIMPVRRVLASYVGVEPRDMRLDRLLRLSLRLMPNGSEEDSQRYQLISILAELANELSKWTRIRLEARHKGSIGELVKDSSELGEALNRIPGPGTPIPLTADEYNLPSPDDLSGLANEVNVLKRRVVLSSSGGVR